MAIKYKTRGFIFKKVQRVEADQTFSVFTEDFGRLELKAKAIRKITSKLRADIDIFYLSDIEFIQGKNDRTLTDASKIKKFGGIVEDCQKLKVAYRVCDILDSFIKGQDKDEALFALLGETFDNLTVNSLRLKNYQLAFHYFFWNFVALQGYKMQIQNYACCQNKLNPYELYFCGKEGGIICGNCIKLKKINPEVYGKINSDVVKILRLILKKDWETISKLKIELSSQKMLEDIYENATHSFCPMHC
jgi:DNA repair protein RecO (recombination protein O)